VKRWRDPRGSESKTPKSPLPEFGRKLDRTGASGKGKTPPDFSSLPL